MNEQERHLIMSLLVAIVIKHGGKLRISMKTLRELSAHRYSFEWEVDTVGEYGTLRARYEPAIIEGEKPCTNLQ